MRSPGPSRLRKDEGPGASAHGARLSGAHAPAGACTARSPTETAAARDPGTWSPGRRQVGAGSSWFSGPRAAGWFAGLHVAVEARLPYSVGGPKVIPGT